MSGTSSWSSIQRNPPPQSLGSCSSNQARENGTRIYASGRTREFCHSGRLQEDHSQDSEQSHGSSSYLPISGIPPRRREGQLPVRKGSIVPTVGTGPDGDRRWQSYGLGRARKQTHRKNATATAKTHPSESGW